jgi:hypothetical protein
MILEIEYTTYNFQLSMFTLMCISTFKKKKKKWVEIITQGTADSTAPNGPFGISCRMQHTSETSIHRFHRGSEKETMDPGKQ